MAAGGVTGAAASAVPTITTIAGGDGGPGVGTGVAIAACAVSTGADETYISGNGVVWRLNPATDSITPIAGVGTSRAGTGNGIPATTAWLNDACATANDSHGNLVLASRYSNEIRVVARQSGTYYGQNMTVGRIYTIAGTGRAGFAGDGGSALKALLDQPEGVSADGAGNVIITDTGNNRVRVLADKSGSFYGQSMKAGDIYTVFARSGVQDTRADRSGNLVGVDYHGTAVWVYAEKTGTFYGQSMRAGTLYTIATETAPFGPYPQAITLDNAGNVVFADGPFVKVVAASTGTFYLQPMTAGQTYTIAGARNGLTGNGVPALQAAIGPAALASESSGALVIGEGLEVRVVPQATGTYYGQPMTAGDIYTVAGGSFSYSGDGGLATQAVLPRPSDTATDAAGNVLVASDAVVRVVAQQTGVFYGQPMTKGDIYTIYTPAAQPSSLAPWDTSVDASGNVVIAGPYSGAFGVAILAEHSATYYGRQMAAGKLYLIYYDNNHLATVRPDHQGNLIITDSSGLGSGTVGGVYVLAGRTGTIYGQPLKAGQVGQIAGGGPAPVESGVPALQAYIQGPYDTTVDSAGNLVIADAGDNMVRVVAEKTAKFYGQSMKAGYIYTVAGNGKTGPEHNGVPALSTALNSPQDAAVDSSGNLVIADTRVNRIRVVAEKTGSFYGQSMKAGDIYLLAGTGLAAFGGDGGLASKAWLTAPAAVTVMPDGGILVSDDSRLRLITP